MLGFLPSGQLCLLLPSAALLKCHGGGSLGKGSRDMPRGMPPVLSLSENYSLQSVEAIKGKDQTPLTSFTTKGVTVRQCIQENLVDTTCNCLLRREVHVAICGGDLPSEPVIPLKSMQVNWWKKISSQLVIKKAQFPSYAILQKHLFPCAICSGKKD